MTDQQKQDNPLAARQNTITTYLKKEVIDSFVTKLNKFYRSNGMEQDKQTINTLKWKIKPKIRNVLYSHDLWGNLYYSRVLQKAQITQKLFLRKRSSSRQSAHTPSAKPYYLRDFAEMNKRAETQNRGQSDHCQLKHYQYEQQKQIQLKKMTSENRSVYNRFMNMVRNNFSQPKTIDQKIKRQELLKKCENYKHLRDTKSTMYSSKFSKTGKKKENKENMLMDTKYIIQSCRLEDEESSKLRTSLSAFGLFCRNVDKKLERRTKDL